MAVEEAIAHFPVTRDLLEHCGHCTKTLIAKVFLPNENIVKKSDHRMIYLDCLVCHLELSLMAVTYISMI